MSLLDLIDTHLARTRGREMWGSIEVRDILLDLRAAAGLELLDEDEPPTGVCPYCWASGGAVTTDPHNWSVEHRTLHGLA